MHSKEHKKIKRFVIFVTIVGGLAGLLFGVDFGVINGSLDLMIKHWNLSIRQGEIITSSLLFGALVGALISGYISNKAGRKNAMLLSGIIFTSGSIVAALSVNYEMMVCMRFVLGLGVGIASFTSPLYLAEIAPYKSRGLIIAVYQLMITIGIFTVFVNNAILSYFSAWRLMIASVAVPAAIMWIGVMFLPKTPRWLMLKGRDNEALDILKKIRYTEADINLEVKEIKEVLGRKKEKISNLLRSKPFISVLLIGIFLQLYQQFDGLNTFMYYSSHIYRAVGFGSHSQVWLTVLIGLINMISTIIAMLFLDRLGRKPILYIGVGFMIICMLGMVVIFSTHSAGHYTGSEKTLFATLSMIFIFARAASTGPIAWIMCSEIFPLKSREFGITITTATNWLCNTMVGRFSLSAFSAFGFAGTFIGFSIVLIAGLFVIILFVPETKGVTLEEIEENLMSGKKLRDIGCRLNSNL